MRSPCRRARARSAHARLPDALATRRLAHRRALARATGSSNNRRHAGRWRMRFFVRWHTDCPPPRVHGRLDGDEQEERDLDGLVAVRLIDDELPAPGERFDAFVSYAHRNYAEVAEQVAGALEARGQRTWLDRRELRLKSRRPRQRRAVAPAVARRSRHLRPHCLLRDDRSAVRRRAGHSRVARELQLAGLRASPRTGSRLCPSPARNVSSSPAAMPRWSNVPELADLLVAHFEKVGPGSAPQQAVEPPWAEAAGELDAQAARVLRPSGSGGPDRCPRAPRRRRQSVGCTAIPGSAMRYWSRCSGSSRAPRCCSRRQGSTRCCCSRSGRGSRARRWASPHPDIVEDCFGHDADVDRVRRFRPTA